MKKLIYLEDAIKAAEAISNTDLRYVMALMALPSAQPEPSQVARDIATIIENEQDMRMILKDAQPEIIRCKECMNHGKEICYFWSHFYGTINTPDDGFCHKAERRTDD